MVIENKQELRKIYSEKRKMLTDKQRISYNRDIVKNFYANISLQPRSVIAGYFPTKYEADISLLLEMYAEDGHTICYPAVEEQGEPLIFRKFVKGMETVKNQYHNFLELPNHAKEVMPNVIITPLLAFDSSGHRLGMGAGYYDRTFDYLSRVTDFIAIGVAYSLQQTQFIRPETHDFKLDALVTEKKTFVF